MRALEHFERVTNALRSLEEDEIDKFVELILCAVAAGGRILLGGNGGSYSIAQHIATDWSKGTYTNNGLKFPCIVLNGNASTDTAIANDLGYENSLLIPLEIMATDKDIVLLISSSGNSPNIVRAAQKAREIGCLVLGLSGFGKSKLFEYSNCCLTIESQDYQTIEDTHAVLGHAIFKEIIDRINTPRSNY